jgi:arginase
MPIPILHIQNACGQPHQGVILKKSQIKELLPIAGGDYKIHLFPKEKCNYKNEYLIDLANMCFSKITEEPFQVFLGGDHSTSFATILGSLKKYGPSLRVLWMDAHADIHSPETSPSGNTHGMPVRFLMNKTPFKDFPRLKANQIMYVGLRSVEEEEWDFIHQKGIKYITAEAFLQNPAAAYTKIQRFVRNRPTHFSFDVDSLDPAIMPSTGTSETGGLLLDHFYTLLKNMRELSAPFFAMDIMEYNPHIGTREERRTSKETMRDIFATLAIPF